MFLYVSGGVLLAAPAWSLVSDGAVNPYRTITERNVFALKPIPIRPTTPVDTPQPPVKLTLCGLTDILGRKQALLKAQIPPRPPQPAKEESYILTERQSEGDIEVLVIDEKAGTVKVMNHGTAQTLDFENNGSKLPSASSLPLASAPPVPGMGFVPPSAIGMAPIPGRPFGVGPGGQSSGYQPGGQPGATPGSQSAQSYQPGGAQGSQPSAFGFNNPTGAATGPANGGAPVDYGLSDQQQSSLIELERARLKESGDPESAAMLPGTEFPQ